MKVKELLAALEGCNPEAEVTMMYQPNYPLESKVSSVVCREDIDEECTDDNCDDVVLTEGKQIGYGKRDAWSW